MVSLSPHRVLVKKLLIHALVHSLLRRYLFTQNVNSTKTGDLLSGLLWSGRYKKDVVVVCTAYVAIEEYATYMSQEQVPPSHTHIKRVNKGRRTE